MGTANPPTSSLPVEYLTESGQLRTLVKDLSNEAVIAVDSESNSRHRYPERVCLIQLATSRKAYLIDTLEVRDMAPLGKLLEDSSVMKVFHAPDYDLRCFDRQWGFRVRNLFDTSTAAKFVGMRRLALSALINELLRFDIAKNERIQRSDWTLRPLSNEALDYAAADVLYLADIQKALTERLHALGRAAWVAEECSRLEEIRHVARGPDVAYLSVKGSSRLNGRQLAVLKCLFIFRDSEARQLDRPPFYVLPDDILVHLAVDPDVDLAKLPSVRSRLASRFGAGLRAALAAGTTAPEAQRPTYARTPPMNQAANTLFGGLKKWRTDLGDKLDIDASLVWPMPSLNRLARAPEQLSTEMQSPQVRQWQRTEFAESLSAAIENHR